MWMKRAPEERGAGPVLGSRTNIARYSTTSCLSERTPATPPIPRVTGTRARRIVRCIIADQTTANETQQRMKQEFPHLDYECRQRKKQISTMKSYLKWSWWHDPFFFSCIFNSSKTTNETQVSIVQRLTSACLFLHSQQDKSDEARSSRQKTTTKTHVHLQNVNKMKKTLRWRAINKTVYT